MEPEPSSVKFSNFKFDLIFFWSVFCLNFDWKLVETEQTGLRHFSLNWSSTLNWINEFLGFYSRNSVGIWLYFLSLIQLWWMNFVIKSVLFHSKNIIGRMLNSHKLCRRFRWRRTEIRWEAARRWSPSRAAAADLRLPLRTRTAPPAPEPESKHSGSAGTSRPRTGSSSSSLWGSTDTVRPAGFPSEGSRAGGEGSGRHEQPIRRRTEADWRRGRGGREGWMDGWTVGATSWGAFK